MIANSDLFQPPEDPRFHWLLEGAAKGFVCVYGIVQQTAGVRFCRFDEKFRPENSPEGQNLLGQIMRAWNAGAPRQPWLYADGGRYIVSDDYFWLAAVERGRPETFAAQVIGEPLPQGVIQKVGPLPPSQVKQMLGLASK